MKRILFSLVVLAGLGLASSPVMAHGYYGRRVCIPACTPTVSTCLPTVTSCTPAPVITQPCAPAVTNCVPTCAPTVYYHTGYRHVRGWSHVHYSRRCR
jgi:hypothetical protein